MWTNFFSTRKDRKLSMYQNTVQTINQYEKTLQTLSDKQLSDKTKEFKKQINAGTSINEILPEAFALVREAAVRVVGLRLFDVQIIGGIVLCQGKIAEMKTGEGKSLLAALPTYLNALMGTGVHIVTVNDYLARRDSESIGNIHRFLGLSVGLIQQNLVAVERKQNYECDITYVTNSELGFDYLRDNLITKLSDKVIRSTTYCVIDEIDSILIDEARTPLIISVNSEQFTTSKYAQTADLAKILQLDIHYTIDEKRRGVTLTEDGTIAAETVLQTNNLYNPKDPWFPYLINALKSKELFKLNIDYIIQNDTVLIIDESTGRIQYGRRWSDGLHQAIEAKEKVTIQRETEVLASITYQHLFLRYNKISGMSGTALTEEVEFDQIYGLEVVEIPTNRPMIRKDLSDLIYKTEYAKWKAIAEECRSMYSIGRPVLVGTTSVEKSDLLSKLLQSYTVTHQLLNARPENIKKEAQIIAQAGQKFTVTIATNMAGRGTDIILGGNPIDISRLLLLHILTTEVVSISNPSDNTLDKFVNAELYKLTCNQISGKLNELDELLKSSPQYYNLSLAELERMIIIASEKIVVSDTLLTKLREIYDIIYNNYKTDFDTQKEDIKNLGGLYVIGSERHESRRIDNQLRGRSGRQGDPGMSRFFLSLEDKLLRIFGGSNLSGLMEALRIDESTPIESPFLTKSIERAQKKVESFYYDARKQLFEYDEILDKHRQAIFAERYRILTIRYLRDYITFYIEQAVQDISEYIVAAIKKQHDEAIFYQLNRIRTLIGIEEPYDIYSIMQFNQEQISLYFREQVRIAYNLKEAYWEDEWPNIVRKLERYILLNSIDTAWTMHLREMNILKDVIGWRSYGQQNPLVEYQNEAFSLFLALFRTVRQGVLSTFFATNMLSTDNNE